MTLGYGGMGKWHDAWEWDCMYEYYRLLIMTLDLDCCLPEMGSGNWEPEVNCHFQSIVQ